MNVMQQDLAPPASLTETGAALRAYLRRAAPPVTEPTLIQKRLSKAILPHTFKTLHAPGTQVAMWHRAVDLDGVSVHFIDYDSCAEGLHIQVEEPDDNIVAEFPLTGVTRLQQGGQQLDLLPGQYSTMQYRAPVSSVMSGKNCSIVLTQRKEWVEAYLATRNMTLQYRSIHFDPTPQDINKQAVLLSSTLSGGLQQDMLEPASFDDPTTAHHMKQLLTSLILNHSPAYKRASRAGVPDDAAPSYVRKAEDYIRTHLGESIEMPDIIRHSGASRRALYDGFRKHRGTTPLSMLKTLRLSAAKSELGNMTSDTCNVTNVAMKYGFTHLGRFSQEFKAQYGLLPSEMLNKYKS